MNKVVSPFALLTLTVLLTGCAQESPTPAPATSSTAPADGTPYLLDAEPEGAGEVIAVRNDAGDGDDVVIVGRIGGSENPWIEDRAAFSIVDNSLKACSDIPGDTCPIPWDYCCETPKLPDATALIKVVNGDGNPVETDARRLLNVKELSTVVVQGKAQRDDAGNLTVLATGIFVRQK